MAKDNSGKIAVGVKQGTIKTSNLDKLIGIGTTYQHSEASRSTEDDALERTAHVPRLNKLQQQILTLERIGRNPKFMPDYPTHDRPARPIYGSALWSWIGRQPGLTLSKKDVEAHLNEISGILKQRAEMGLNE